MKLDDYLRQTANVTLGLKALESDLERAVDLCCCALGRGNKIIFCGNGGSAADAQHFAAEFMGRFLLDRNPLPAVSLTVDTSALTAIANDYGYENVFSRQLRGIGAGGDVLFGLSTSGNSRNVIEAFKMARSLEISTIGLTGSASSSLDCLSDVLFKVDSEKTNFIQEAHFVLGHYICLRVESFICQAN